MRIHQLILSCVCSLFVLLGTTTLAFAQDENSEQNYNSEVSETEGYNTEISIGAGLGIYIGFDVNLEVLHQFGEYYRLGLSEKLEFSYNWVHSREMNFKSTTLVMNEFVAYHGEVFELTPRLGIGLIYDHSYFDDDYSGREYTLYELGLSAGLGFGWQVTDHINIGFNLDYTFGCVLASEYKRTMSDDEKHTVTHMVNLNFNIGYRF